MPPSEVSLLTGMDSVHVAEGTQILKRAFMQIFFPYLWQSSIPSMSEGTTQAVFFDQDRIRYTTPTPNNRISYYLLFKY